MTWFSSRNKIQDKTNAESCAGKQFQVVTTCIYTETVNIREIIKSTMGYEFKTDQPATQTFSIDFWTVPITLNSVMSGNVSRCWNTTVYVNKYLNVPWHSPGSCQLARSRPCLEIELAQTSSFQMNILRAIPWSGARRICYQRGEQHHASWPQHLKAFSCTYNPLVQTVLVRTLKNAVCSSYTILNRE